MHLSLCSDPRVHRIAMLTIVLVSGCAGGGSGDTTASITSMGANATHSHYSGDAALGDWSGAGPQAGTLVGVSTNLDQVLELVLTGPTPTQGATYSLVSDSGSFLKYGDTADSKATRVWLSAAGTATIDAITGSTTDQTKTLRVSFANVTAQPAANAYANTATGNLTLQGSALIEGVSLPVQ